MRHLHLLKAKKPRVLPLTQPFILPEKTSTELRIGFLLPFSGEFKTLGKDIAGGADGPISSA